jgi:hypothetical protein
LVLVRSYHWNLTYQYFYICLPSHPNDCSKPFSWYALDHPCFLMVHERLFYLTHPWWSHHFLITTLSNNFYYFNHSVGTLPISPLIVLSPSPLRESFLNCILGYAFMIIIFTLVASISYHQAYCWAYASSPKVLQEEAVFGGSCLYKMAEDSSSWSFGIANRLKDRMTF